METKFGLVHYLGLLERANVLPPHAFVHWCVLLATFACVKCQWKQVVGRSMRRCNDPGVCAQPLSAPSQSICYRVALLLSIESHLILYVTLYFNYKSTRQ